jgi:hypothetical protein
MCVPLAGRTLSKGSRVSLFDFTFALSAVVLGLALTEIAAAIHRLLLAGRRVRWAPEPVLLTLIVLIVIVAVWMGAWNERHETVATVEQVMLQVLKLITLYFAAASVLPHQLEEPLSLYDYYDQTRPLSFGALIVSLLLFRAYDMAVAGVLAIDLRTVMHLLVYLAVYGSLIFVRVRWLNVLLLAFVIAFYGWQIMDLQITA